MRCVAAGKSNAEIAGLLWIALGRRARREQKLRVGGRLLVP
jgi:hypothetical protein